jgi:hypothetical protein
MKFTEGSLGLYWFYFSFGRLQKWTDSSSKFQDKFPKIQQNQNQFGVVAKELGELKIACLFKYLPFV